MTDQKRHALAAFDADAGQLLYRTATEGWTSSVEDARGFSCRREANDYLRQYNLTEHRVPFQLVSVPVYDCVKAEQPGNTDSDVAEPLCTGIYG